MKIQNKIIILLVFIAAIIFTAFILFIAPSIRSIKKISSNITEMKNDIGETKTDTRNIVQTIKDVREKNEEFSKAYVKEGQELDLITTLENLAALNNMSQKINIAQNTETEKKLTLNLDGDYMDLLKYLYGMRRLDYYILVSKISIASASQKTINVKNENQELIPSSGKISADISASFYMTK